MNCALRVDRMRTARAARCSREGRSGTDLVCMRRAKSQGSEPRAFLLPSASRPRGPRTSRGCGGGRSGLGKRGGNRREDRSANMHMHHGTLPSRRTTLHTALASPLWYQNHHHPASARHIAPAHRTRTSHPHITPAHHTRTSHCALQHARGAATAASGAQAKADKQLRGRGLRRGLCP